MNFKYRVYQQFLEMINEKIALKQQQLADLRFSASNETKSTAGDKHETALAMLQIEQANNGRQLDELLQQKATLLKIDPAIKAIQIGNGSLVKTDLGYFFISAALGKILIDDVQVLAVSPNSPLGTKFWGLIKNDTTTLKGRTYKIEKID